MRIEPREAVITDAADVLSPVIDHLRAADVKVTAFENGVPHEQIVHAVAKAPVAVIGGMRFGMTEIDQLTETGLLLRAGIGYDVIDVDAATANSIWVANVPDFCADEVADHTILMLLSALRRLPESMTTWRTKNKWHVTAELPEMRRASSIRLGLLGLGRIGRLVAQRAKGFGIDVVSYDPNLTETEQQAHGASPVSQSELLATSDAISLHVPLTPESKHILDRESLARTKPGAVIINTSRGGLIDLDALDDGLNSGHVGYAALDVLDGEPDPDLDHPILTRPNVLVTSHTAWFSKEAARQLSINTAEEVLRFLDGVRPLNLINPDARAFDSGD